MESRTFDRLSNGRGRKNLCTTCARPIFCFIPFEVKIYHSIPKKSNQKPKKFVKNVRKSGFYELSALRWGSKGREFNSHHPDHLKQTEPQEFIKLLRFFIFAEKWQTCAVFVHRNQSTKKNRFRLAFRKNRAATRKIAHHDKKIVKKRNLVWTNPRSFWLTYVEDDDATQNRRKNQTPLDNAPFLIVDNSREQ
jgi:hypothetical protein